MDGDDGCAHVRRWISCCCRVIARVLAYQIPQCLSSSAPKPVRLSGSSICGWFSPSLSSSTCDQSLVLLLFKFSQLSGDFCLLSEEEFDRTFSTEEMPFSAGVRNEIT